MANFPIEYSKALPSGKSGAVPLNLDVNTGEGMIGRAVQQFGKVGLGIATNIIRSENAAELSTMKRKSNEIWNAAWGTFQKTQDPDEREKILSKAKADAGGITSKRDSVNQDYQIHLDNSLPQWDRWYGDLDRGMRQKAAREDITFNSVKQLESGDIEGYHETIQSGFDANLYGPEEFEFLRDNAETNMVFAQARVEMDTEPQKAVLRLQALDGLSGKQLDARDKLISYATSKKNQYTVASTQLRSKKEAEYHGKIIQGDTDIRKMSQEILSLDGLSDEDKVELAKDVELQFRNWGSTIGGKNVSTNIAIRNMEKAVDDIVDGRIEKAEYWNVLSENKAGLSPSDQKKYIQDVEPAWDKMVQNVSRIADNAAKGQIIKTSDAVWELMQIQRATGKMSGDIFNAESMMRSGQTMIYTDYQMAVHDLKAKDLPGKEYRDQLKVIGRMYSAKNWVDVYNSTEALKKEFTKKTKSIRTQFDTQLSPGSWQKLDPRDQAAIIKRIAGGQSMKDVFSAIKAGDL